MNYITLHQYKVYRGLDQTITTDDALITDLIERASRWIDTYTMRRYDVRVETRLFDVPKSKVSAFGVFDTSLIAGSGYEKALRVKDDLLAVTELKNGDGTVISSTDYLLEPAEYQTKSRIRLINGETWCGDDDGNDLQVISLNGIWGYHERYDQAWISSLDKIADLAGITAASTTITVGDADGTAADLRSPRFQAGQMIRMGTEFCLVISTSTLANTIEVVRGYNGSTAAVHAKDTAIDIYRPMGNIVQACLRLTAWLYVQKDADVFDKTYNTITGVSTTPTAVPPDVLKMLGAPKASI